MSTETQIAIAITYLWSGFVGMAVVLRVTRWAWREHRRFILGDTESGAKP